MEKSYLTKLIGQIIKEVDTGINTIYPINKSENSPDSTITISVVLIFEDYILSINNKLEVLPNYYKSFDELEGLKVINTFESKEAAELHFDNGGLLRVDLRDEAYLNDPEAISLSGPDDFWVVWS